MWQCTRPGLPARNAPTSSPSSSTTWRLMFSTSASARCTERGERVAPGRVLEVDGRPGPCRGSARSTTPPPRSGSPRPRAGRPSRRARRDPGARGTRTDRRGTWSRRRRAHRRAAAPAHPAPRTPARRRPRGRVGRRPASPGCAESTAGSPGPVVASSPGTGSRRSLAATVSLAAHSSRVCTGAYGTPSSSNRARPLIGVALGHALGEPRVHDGLHLAAARTGRTRRRPPAAT